VDSGFLGPQFAVTFVSGLLVGALAMVLVGGALLKLSVRWVGGYSPGYWRSCLAVLVACIVGVVAQVLLALVVRAAPGFDAMMPGMPVSIALALAGMAVLVAAATAAVRLLLRKPDGTRLALPRAAGAAALFVALGTALYVVVLGILILAVGGVPDVSR
jgi:hypothetical protein